MREIFTIVTVGVVLVCPSLLSANAIPQAPSSESSSLDEDSIDMPARAPQFLEPDPARVSRKPAVEPRVYIESANSKTGYVYYDYTDQKPTTDPARVQHPPEQ